MQISFKGLNENIAIGRMAIRDVKETYPRGFVSNSRYDKFSTSRNSKISSKLAKPIRETRDLVEYKKRLGVNGYQAVAEAVKKTNAANCGEQAVLVSESLNKFGVKNKVISMCVYSQTKNAMNYIDGHTFCVIGLADDAIGNKPETWGKDAVVVDLWTGIVDKADKTIKSYEKLLDYNRKNPKPNHKLIFTTESIW